MDSLLTHLTDVRAPNRSAEPACLALNSYPLKTGPSVLSSRADAVGDRRRGPARLQFRAGGGGSAAGCLQQTHRRPDFGRDQERLGHAGAAGADGGGDSAVGARLAKQAGRQEVLERRDRPRVARSVLGVSAFAFGTVPAWVGDPSARPASSAVWFASAAGGEGGGYRGDP